MGERFDWRQFEVELDRWITREDDMPRMNRGGRRREDDWVNSVLSGSSREYDEGGSYELRQLHRQKHGGDVGQAIGRYAEDLAGMRGHDKVTGEDVMDAREKYDTGAIRPKGKTPEQLPIDFVPTTGDRDADTAEVDKRLAKIDRDREAGDISDRVYAQQKKNLLETRQSLENE